MAAILSDPGSPPDTACPTPFSCYSSTSSATVPLLQDMESRIGQHAHAASSPLSRSYGTAEKVEGDVDPAVEGHPSSDDETATVYSSDDDDAQAGVRGIEAISRTWSKWSLILAYIGVFLLAFATSLEQQTTTNLTAYATSSFAKHSLLATISVVSGVVNAVIKPPMSKIANVFGRLEAFAFAVLLYVCGYIQQAGSRNVQTFASAQIFYSAGSQGLQMLQQIFIADTSSLMARALFSSLPDTPFLVTTWVGSPIAQSFVQHSTWRWGYGVWAIVLPVAFLPLALSLFVNLRKAAKQGLLPARPWRKDRSLWSNLKKLYFELDVMGLLILSAAVALVLIPLTLAATVTKGWHNPSIIAMLVIGCVCWVVFPIWELTPRLSPKPFLSLKMLRTRNVIVGCTLGFFYFAVFYTSIQPYFYSYLQVVHFESITAAGHVTQTFSFSSTVTAVTVSLLIWKTKHFKYFIVAGGAIYLMAVGLIMRYRVEGSSTGQLVGAQIALGIGGGMINVPAQLAVQSAVPHTDVAAATALFLTLVEIGGAVGAGVSGAIWTANLPRKLEAYLPDGSKSLAPQVYSNLSLALSFPAGSPERVAVNRSYQETMNLLLIVSLCFAAMPFLLSLGLEDYRLDEVAQQVKGKVMGGGGGDGGSGGGGDESEENEGRERERERERRESHVTEVR